VYLEGDLIDCLEGTESLVKRGFELLIGGEE
jgi:hypothetical protein